MQQVVFPNAVNDRGDGRRSFRTLKPMEARGHRWLFEALPAGVENANAHYARLARETGLDRRCLTRRVQEAFHHVVDLFERAGNGKPYHNLRHVLDVFSEATLLGRLAGISEKELETLQIAALFHDAGCLVSMKRHEARGAGMAASWAGQNHFIGKWLDMRAIEGAIRATRFRTRKGHFVTAPQNLVEALLCDADVAARGRHDFALRADEYMRENPNRGKMNGERTLALARTAFHTQAARELGYEEMRGKNLEALEARAADKA